MTMMKNKGVTVSELVSILLQMPQNYSVYIHCSEDHMCFPLRRVVEEPADEKAVTLFGADFKDKDA